MNDINKIINSLEEDIVLGKNKLQKAEHKLDELKRAVTELQGKNDDAELWDINQLADYTKYAVTTLRHMVCKKAIPFNKVAGSNRVTFTPSVIKEWLAKNSYQDTRGYKVS